MVEISHPFEEQDQVVIRDILLKKNGTVIFQTETLPAIGCRADSQPAVEKIYQLKKREKSLPLLVLVSSWEMLEQYAHTLTEEQTVFLKKYWPGPLTVILKSKKNLATNLNYHSHQLAFRMTSSVIAKDLVEICQVPIVGTSANYSNSPEVNDINFCKKVFSNQVDLFINSKSTIKDKNLPTTLIKLYPSGKFDLIRQGSLRFGQPTNH